MLWATRTLIKLIERGMVSDALIRRGIRSLLKQRLSTLPLNDARDYENYLSRFLDRMASAPVAPLPEKANEQHYELPSAFFAFVLGTRRKYSSCYWPDGVEDLDEAEFQALTETCSRAELSDGQTILELGCGWGSLSLWMAQHYPASRITAVSNSHSQKADILARAARAGFTNIDVITCDMNDFSPGERFDRIVSVEMFEHMRNWQELFGRVAGWLHPDGRFFLHIFCHRSLPYEFVVEDESDWMSRYFFSGGMMPSYDLPLHFEDRLRLIRRWGWNGKHYERTANAWVANMDRHKAQIWPILSQTYGAEWAPVWWMRWRIFFMACAELFGYHDGEEWLVGHYLFERQAEGPEHRSAL
jgi:cyclopropane-fatty-acyl-phospholipid synthase